MSGIIFRGVLTALAVLLAAATVGITPAMARDSEADRLGQEMSSIIFDAINFRDVMIKGAASELGSMKDLAEGRPEWPGLLQESIVEEFDHDMPAIKAMLGRGFARHFTVEELRAGVVILADPGLQQIMKAAAANSPPPTPEPTMSKKVERLSQTPAGRSFLEKFGNIDGMLEGLSRDLIVEIIPGTFRRFADKADALEAARAP
ncbi:MAG: hypothetical protein Q8J89_03600 [Caulobacter sp.]|nr:hypothetical protein [Caulobacter sp.]